MSPEDRALERLMEKDRDDEGAPRTDAEHRRIFGWGWDDPDDGGDLDLLWGPPEAV